MLKKIKIKTNKKCEFVNITRLVEDFVSSSKTTSGTVTIYCPHTTAGITINENADPDVGKDMLMKIAEFIQPVDQNYKHFEGNSDSHIKASLFGASETVIIEDSELLLGTWQGVFFCEFDGSRDRTVYIKIQPDPA